MPGPSHDVAGVTSDETSNRYNESARRPHPGADGRLRDGERQPCTDAACGYHLSVTRAGPKAKSAASPRRTRCGSCSRSRWSRSAAYRAVRPDLSCGGWYISLVENNDADLHAGPEAAAPVRHAVRCHDHVRRDGGERAAARHAVHVHVHHACGASAAHDVVTAGRPLQRAGRRAASLQSTCAACGCLLAPGRELRAARLGGALAVGRFGRAHDGCRSHSTSVCAYGRRSRWARRAPDVTRPPSSSPTRLPVRPTLSIRPCGASSRRSRSER